MTAQMKPPMPYFGGKNTLAAAIVELLPAHDHYVEPFAGSLAVLLAKPVSMIETVNDLDQAIVTFWRVLRDRPDDLIRACALTPHARAEYDLIVNRIDLADDLETARRVWAKLTQARSGRLVRTAWRYYVTGHVGMSMTDMLEGYVSRLAPAAERLRHVTLECRPALDVIDRYGADPNVLLYVDPPYLGSARGPDTAYRHELKTDAEHTELAEHLLAAKASVVLSGYHSPLYDQLFDGWESVDLAASTAHADGTRLDRTEVLWSNRQITAEHLFSDANLGVPGVL